MKVENAVLRLNDKTASIGFIYGRIGETMNLFGAVLGVPTDVKNTTMRQTENNQRIKDGVKARRDMRPHARAGPAAIEAAPGCS